ncbi:hypothetical protein PIB30_053452 [Stylosanthes scabra]|uniref:PB1-like domain-containing protein n=1 Tax=Stylosanthes scabra TaxID=79078 RepID=A0ABU6TIV8_9FABA|nr:hypothetical protein [Stylosanthes scabra]
MGEDRRSLLEVVQLVTKIGYPKNGIAAIWFKSVAENTEDGLKMLRPDKDALELAQIGVRDDIVEMYVVHKHSFYKKSCTIEKIEVEEVVGPVGLGVGPIDDNHKESSTELEGGFAELEDSESRSDDDSQDEDFEPTSDGSNTDLPWSDIESAFEPNSLFWVME